MYIFIGKQGKYQIPQGVEVKVIKFYPRRRVIIEYEGKKILTFSTLLRRRNSP